SCVAPMRSLFMGLSLSNRVNSRFMNQIVKDPFAFPIDPRQVGASRCSDTRRFGELRQKLLIALARISPHDAAQRRVRFERRRVDANRLALHQASRAQALEYPGKDGPMGLERNQATGP